MAVGTWQRGSTVCTYTTYTYDYRHCSNKLNVEHLPKCWTLPLKQQCLRLAVACVQPLVSECTLLSCIVAAPSSVRSLRCSCVATSADPRWPAWLPLQPGWRVTAAGSGGGVHSNTVVTPQTKQLFAVWCQSDAESRWATQRCLSIGCSTQ